MTYYPACDNSYKSLIDALKSIGVDSSAENRKIIASLNDIPNYTRTEAQNLELLNKLKEGKLIKSKATSSTSTSTSSTSNEMIKKLEQSSKYSSKITTLSIIGTLLFENNYPTSFIAGVLGNIYHEGKIGFFESSAYKNLDRKPQYLKYMDELYKYAEKYSGKIITEVSMNELNDVMNKLKADKWQKGKFGLGCIQWTGERTYELVKLYVNEAKGKDKITIDEATSAEGKLIIKELNGEYKRVFNEWQRSASKNGEQAAYEAADILCRKYEIPADAVRRGKERGQTAVKIYRIMMKGV